MGNFSESIFNLFPPFFRDNDSYKDGNGKGLLQRYLEALGKELDLEVLNKVPKIQDLVNADFVASKHLVHLADVLGNPPDTFGDELKYRKLLKYICYINKHKGTVRGYELLFNILGVEVEIEEIPITTYKYDSEHQYDTHLTYDGNCPPCSNYILHITDAGGNCPEIGDAQGDVTLRQALDAIIAYVEPINAKLQDITYNGTSIEPGWILSTGFWDDSKTWLDTGIWVD